MRRRNMLKGLNHLLFCIPAVTKVVKPTSGINLFGVLISTRNHVSVIRERRKRHPNEKGVLHFWRLRRRGASFIDSSTVLGVLRAHTKAASTTGGKKIHALIINLGLQSIFIHTALLDMYSKTGNLNDACLIFNEMPQRTVVCWTALISAYVNNRRPNDALEVFRRMQEEGVEPDKVAVTAALSACADLGALAAGGWIDAYICRKEKRLRKDLILINALIDMYSKCGDVKAARNIFDNADNRDVTSWTSMIIGHAIHGQSEEALRLFAQMESATRSHDSSRVRPNSITFIGVLMACSHAGLVEEGCRHWESMAGAYGLKPQIAHYGCMVDLLCRAGLLREAHALIKGMPMQPTAVIWRALLGACSAKADIELGAHVRCRLMKLNPRYSGDNVTMSNAYAAAGMWDEKQEAREEMGSRKPKRRSPGCSLIEVDNRVREFVAADRKHLNNWECQGVIRSLVENSRTCIHVAE